VTSVLLAAEHKGDANVDVATTIVFRGMERSEALEANIRQQVARLRKFAADLRTCKVVVAADTLRHQQGGAYRIGVHAAVGRREIDVGVAHDDARHGDPYVAVSDAFDSLRRLVEADAERRRGDSKRNRRNFSKSKLPA